MKRYIIIVVLTLAAAPCLFAQINRGGEPYAFGNTLDNPVEVVMPAVDVEKYLLEDARNTDSKHPFRFGAELDTNLSLTNAGAWQQLPNGDRVWQLKVTCRGAKTLNFVFDRFVIPQGGRMFIYTPDRKYVTGAFTEQSNNPEHVFSTSLYPGQSVIMEYYEPLSVRGASELTLSTVIHGYRDIFFKSDKGAYGTSGSCNININCPEGANWQLEKRGVALILNRGSAHCSGALINNTSNDGTPYFLTANHCVSGYGSNPSNFVFVFMHESATCSGTSGPTIYSVNYASLIANASNSDFALLKLNDTVPLSYNPLYLGWSRSTAAPTSMTCIHHPSGDLKKISHAGAGTSSTYLDNTSDDGTHWCVSRWLQGTTEGGSSGSPLFNQNHQIIGQLHGGDASCSDRQGSDYYGKFSYSWTNNNASSSSERLKDWLDPNNTGAVTCPAYDPCTSSLSNDVVVSNNGIDSTYCNISSIDPEIRIANRGNDTLRTLVIKYQLDNQTPQQYSWSGTLILNMSQAVALNSVPVTPGSHVLTIWSELPNGLADQNTSNDTIRVPFVVNSGTEVAYRISIPEQYSSYIDWFGSYISWQFVRDDGTVLASHNELTSVDFSETFCTGPGCYTLRMTISSYLSRLINELTLQGYVNGGLVRTVTGTDTISFCTTDVGLDLATEQNDFELYPNPANPHSRVFVDFADAAPRQYFIIDSKGTVVSQGCVDDGHNEIALPETVAGLYFIQVVGSNSVSVKKLIIK
ncbi:MAG: trypsin-like peptidase domain-containing protein [Bacteroidales bacterium]|nr:trypsin-like peptidase domain-containing protein [Bacteroidales bacterium]